MTFDELITDIKEARAHGERILKEQGIENVNLGEQNVMLQFWQIEVMVEEVARLRSLIMPSAVGELPSDWKPSEEETVEKETIPFNKNLKKDTNNEV